MDMTFKLIKAGIAAVALSAVPFSVQAADVPVKAPYYKGMPSSVVSYYNWSGFYLGVNAGYGFGSSTWDFPAVKNSPKGMLFGGTAGYNWQSGAWVYGVEGDFDWSGVKGSVACPPGGSCQTKSDWLATFRGRIGYAFDRFLPYLTAGGAISHVKATNTGATPGFEGASATPFGFTGGLGLEYAFLGNLTAKIEYLYVDLGKFNCAACGATPDNVTFKESIIRAGLNYKFSGPLLSRY
jgi:outer membrane immunogenic protein